MAVAISPTTVGARSTARSAASWTGISAAIAVIATVPLVLMLIGSVSSMMFVRGGGYEGDWVRAFTVTMIPLAPATYAIFCAFTADLLKNKVAKSIRSTTLKVAAAGAVPYFVLAGIGFSADIMVLKVLAMLTIPLAMAATIWTAANAK